MLLLLVTPLFAEDAIQSSDQIDKVEYIYESLSTWNCNPGNLDMTQSCHVEGSDSAKRLIDNCGFKDECLRGYKPVCVDIDDGMVFICVPLNIKCAEGNMNFFY